MKRIQLAAGLSNGFPTHSNRPSGHVLGSRHTDYLLPARTDRVFRRCYRNPSVIVCFSVVYASSTPWMFCNCGGKRACGVRAVKRHHPSSPHCAASDAILLPPPGLKRAPAAPNTDTGGSSAWNPLRKSCEAAEGSIRSCRCTFTCWTVLGR